MENKEILEKVKAKAEANGWMPPIQVRWSDDYNDIIWRHDFAKAYWGEEIVCEYCGDCMNTYPCRICSIEPQNTPMYIYQLGEMAKEKEPLKYLEQFLD